MLFNYFFLYEFDFSRMYKNILHDVAKIRLRLQVKYLNN